MIPTTETLDRIQSSMIAEGLGTANYTVQLSQGNFNELTGEGFELADFDGYADITVNDAFDGGIDAVSNQRELVLPPPVGGFKFTAGAGVEETQRIYGYRVIDADAVGTPALGHKLLPDPIDVEAEGEVVHIQESVRFLIDATALS